MNPNSTLNHDQPANRPRSAQMAHKLFPLVRKALFQLDAEVAHELTLAGLRTADKCGLVKPLAPREELNAPVEVMGITFPNRVGLAPGMDKKGNTVDAFHGLGFGHVEVGTVTMEPQYGNTKPRLFRLSQHDAIVNRMGFNSPGMEAVLQNLTKQKVDGVLGINIGKNKDTPEEGAIDEYVRALGSVYDQADYITVNLSSPNTPGLRDLQNIDKCRELLRAVMNRRDELTEDGEKKPIAVKLAPDLNDDDIHELAVMLNEIGIDGVILTNTTRSRKGVEGHEHAEEMGGLSGAPLAQRSLECLKVCRKSLDDNIRIISVGGIMSGEDARKRIQAGAALVQIYTGLVYRGPELVHDIIEQTSNMDMDDK